VATATPLIPAQMGRGIDNGLMHHYHTHTGVQQERFPNLKSTAREHKRMATYLMLTSFVDKGERSAQDYAERINEINKEIDFRGGKVLAQYALLGPYDFVMIVEAPGDEVIAKLAIHLRAVGPLQTTTFAAIPMQNLVATLQDKPRSF
jgi:uncharacterized protein with GYD domain